MKKPKVFVARPIPHEVEQFLGHHCEYDIWREAEAMPRHVLLEKLADKERLNRFVSFRSMENTS